MAKLELAIAIKLIQNNFQKGIDKVRASLKSLHYQTIAIASALGAGGIAVGNFVGKLREIARESNRANIALKNISKSASDYSKNVDFLFKLSNTYKQNLNNLTENYAKFKASADSAGVSISEQQHIFESFIRTLTAFGLGGEKSNLALMALQQMMAKGKISSEELRRQMGEHIPIAMEAMARAAGVTIDQLDKLLRDGKLLSKDVLPRFAEELNKMVENVDTDNLETSFTQVGNTLIQIVDKWGLVDKFKWVVDKTRSLLVFLKDETVTIFSAIAGGIAGSKLPSLFSLITRKKDVVIKAEKELERATAQVARRTEQYALAQERVNTARANGARNISRLVQREQQALNALEKAKEQQAVASTEAQKARQMSLWRSIRNNAVGAFNAIKASFSSVFSSLVWGAVFMALGAVISKVVEWVNHQKKINNLVKDYENGIKNIDYGQQVSDLQNLLKLVEDQNSKEEDKKGLLAQINKEYGYSLQLNGDLSRQLEYQISLLKQQEQLRYHKEKSYEATKRQEEILGYFNTSDDPNAPNYREKVREQLIKSGSNINLGLGLAGTRVAKELKPFFNTQDWAKPAVIEIEGLAKEMYKLEQVSKSSAKNISNLSKASFSYQRDNFAGVYNDRIRGIKENDERGLYASHDEFASEMLSEANNALKSYRNLGIDDPELLKRIKADIDKFSPKSTVYSTDEDSKKSKESPLERAEREYADTLKEIQNQKELGLITEKEYTEKLREASERATLDIGGILGGDAIKNETFQKAKENTVRALSDEERALQEATETIKASERRGKLLGLSEEQARQEYVATLNRVLENLVKVDSSDPKFLQQIASYKTQRDDALKMPVLGSRDKTFDYKKGEDEITKEEIALLEQYRDGLLKLQEVGKNVATEIDNVQSEITSLSSALKLQTVKRDVEELNKEIGEATYNSIKTVANSAQNLVRAFKSMRNAFTNEDVSPFERLLNVFNTLQQTLEGVLGVVQIFERIGEMSKKLDLMTKALEALTSAQQGLQSVSNATADGITGVAEAQGDAVGEAVAGAGKEIVSSKAVTKAKIEEATAKILAANASAGPVGAVKAGAEIALMIATIKAAGATAGFAQGGLVNYGSPWGDKTFIRVNRGERVINAEQQEWLQRLAKGFRREEGVGSVSVNGEFRLRAGDLYAVVENEKRRIAR